MRYRYYYRNPIGIVFLCTLIFVPLVAALLIVAAFFLTPIVVDTIADNFVDIYKGIAVVTITVLVFYLITEIEKDHKAKRRHK